MRYRIIKMIAQIALMQLIFCNILLVQPAFSADEDSGGNKDGFNLVPLEILKQQELQRQRSRVKDIVTFEGIRDNILMGYGLIVGLQSTGDDMSKSSFTAQEFKNLLGKMGVSSTDLKLKTKSVAAVTVTATLPPFARVGNKIDVRVNVLGDAKSLSGGTLLPTSLIGADGKVYAMAQGLVIIIKDNGRKRNEYLTTGYIQNGGIVEDEIDFSLDSMTKFRLYINHPDVTTANNIASAVSEEIGQQCCKALDPSTVEVQVPPRYLGNVMPMIQKIQGLEVYTDSKAAIIINPHTNSIIITRNVKLHEVALAFDNISLHVGQAFLMQDAVTLSDLVDGLSKLKISTQEIIEIIKGMQRAHALEGEVIIE